MWGENDKVFEVVLVESRLKVKRGMMVEVGGLLTVFNMMRVKV